MRALLGKIEGGTVEEDNADRALSASLHHIPLVDKIADLGVTIAARGCLHDHSAGVFDGHRTVGRNDLPDGLGVEPRMVPAINPSSGAVLVTSPLPLHSGPVARRSNARRFEVEHPDYATPLAPQMRSNGCTRSLSGGSRRRPCCPPPRRLPCRFGRCSPQDKSPCERSTAGKRSPPRPSLSPLTSPPETIPSCSRRSRCSNFQPLSRRHLALNRLINFRAVSRGTLFN